MRERFHSTAELARICGVSISTIKRWTDSGLLRCVRTPGGHRKFRLQDVAEAARRLQTSMALPEAAATVAEDELTLLLLARDRQALTTRLAGTLASGDESGLCRWLTELVRHGLTVADTGCLLAEALYSLRSTADDFVLRRATRLAEGACRHLRAQLPPALDSAPKALLAASGGASLGLGLAALSLTACGWQVVDLGEFVPGGTLRAGIESERPQLVILVGTSPGSPEAAALQRGLEAPPFEICALPAGDESTALAALVRRLRLRAEPAAVAGTPRKYRAGAAGSPEGVS